MPSQADAPSIGLAFGSVALLAEVSYQVGFQQPARQGGQGVARTSEEGPGRMDRVLLSPLIHGRARLLILSFLLRGRKAVSFTELRKGLAFTDGSLSVHLTKLLDGGLIQVEKTYAGKRPLTLVKVTPKGRRNFRQYINDLVDIVPGLGDA